MISSQDAGTLYLGQRREGAQVGEDKGGWRQLVETGIERTAAREVILGQQIRARVPIRHSGNRLVGEGYRVVCSGRGGLVSAEHGTHVRVVTDTDNVTCTVADTDNMTCTAADTNNVI